MTYREFIPKGSSAGRDGHRLVLEMERDGRVSWRLLEGRGPGGLDNGGDTFEERGQEQMDRAAELLAGDWEELT